MNEKDHTLTSGAGHSSLLDPETMMYAFKRHCPHPNRLKEVHITGNASTVDPKLQVLGPLISYASAEAAALNHALNLAVLLKENPMNMLPPLQCYLITSV